MELGLQVWHDRNGRVDGLRQVARDAESAGYRSLTVPDHLGDRSPAPLTVCALLIEATDRVAVGPLVLNNDLRHPVVLAREVVALSELSGGRFELGLGAGWDRFDYAVTGLAFDPLEHRLVRLGETVAMIRDVCAGRHTTASGSAVTAATTIRPVPRHIPPIVIGGNSRAIQAFAASEADIVGLTGFSSRRSGIDLSDFGLQAATRQLARIRRLADAAGRKPRVQALVQWAQITRSRRRVAEDVGRALGIAPSVVLESPYVLLGTQREILDQLHEHNARLGIDRWTLFANNPSRQPSPLRPFAPVAEALT